MVHQPSWFKEASALIVNAPTCGINKDGNEQYVVDPGTGARSTEIDDKLAEYIEQVVKGKFDAPHVVYRSLGELEEKGIFVPQYFDTQTIDDFEAFIDTRPDLQSQTLGELIHDNQIRIWGGHGSPSQDQRLGDIPYIKVSDLRAGHVNINPTNMVPLSLAEKHWSGKSSGLAAYDLMSPERASKNIGEFCVLMPGQERIVLTKEVICIRALSSAHFDQFFLMWALSLVVVRRQWDRIVFMQTNREDVGGRVREIKIPVPTNDAAASAYAAPFRRYYKDLEQIRTRFASALKSSGIEHHIFLKE